MDRTLHGTGAKSLGRPLELRGEIRPLPDNAAAALSPERDATALIETLKREPVETLLVVGDVYEDMKSAGISRLRESLVSAGIALQIHVPKHGVHAGIWAAARLAARTLAV